MSNNKPTHVNEIITPILEQLDKTNSLNRYSGIISTGFEALDRVIGGLHPSSLVAIGARPGMGKTSLALSIARNAAIEQNKTVSYFSYNLSERYITKRLLMQMSNIECYKLSARESLNEKEREAIHSSGKLLAGSKLYIADNANNSIEDINRELERMESVDLAIIDYMQLLSVFGTRYSLTDTSIEISNGLAYISKALKLPIIVLSQLPHDIEMREGAERRPMLSDLQMCGLDKNADDVLFLYRDAYYDDEENVHDAECIVAKNRNGDTGTVRLFWDDKLAMFKSII